MKDEILSMLDGMNETQLRNVLDYTKSEYEEEGFEAHALEMIMKLQREVVLAKLKLALQTRKSFPRVLMGIVDEECARILESSDI